MSEEAWQELQRRVEQGPAILCDGGTGTEKRRTGSDARDVHRAFVRAGAELVVADTFGLVTGDGTDLETRVNEAHEHASESGARFVVVSAGPTPPFLGWSYDERVEFYTAFVAGLPQLLFVETLLNLQDADAARDAAFTHGVPEVVTFAFGADGVGFGGLTVEDVAEWARAARPRAVGFNCGVGPASVLDAARRLRALCPEVPLSLRPAASAPGFPEASPEDFAAFGREAVALGATLIGGCCGATPAHIAALRDVLRR